MSSALERSCEDSGPSLLFGNTHLMSNREILSHLPSKHSCDIMIERYFFHQYPPLRKCCEGTFTGSATDMTRHPPPSSFPKTSKPTPLPCRRVASLLIIFTILSTKGSGRYRTTHPWLGLDFCSGCSESQCSIIYAKQTSLCSGRVSVKTLQ